MSVTVVLYEPQDDINIGSVVRACTNFDIDDIRLVRPARADPARVLISTPNAQQAVASLKRFDDLDEALADCVRVYGATARSRKAAREVFGPAAAAQQSRTFDGRVAFLFGREDHGLPNDALDRCDAELVIPTSPHYRSLNLAQAVLLVVWELHRLRADPGATTLRSEHDVADRAQVERLFQLIDSTLGDAGFYKYGDGEHVMRSIRSVLSRSQLDARELAIWFGVFKELGQRKT